MRTFLAAIAGLTGGFILGIALSSFIGVLGLYVFHEPLGIKFLPFFTAAICVVLVPLLDLKSRNSDSAK